MSGQHSLSGRITDKKGEPLFAVNIYLKSDITTGVASDLDGSFKINYTSKVDTIVVSFLGFESQYLATKDIDGDYLEIKLKQSSLNFEQITVLAQEPISEEFAVGKLEKLDIYFDPFAQGDALRSVSTSPYATTVDESANPSLRGSSADRSNVFFNGVPIYNPVRNSQINGIGNFSIFNTELIDNQYIYPSNPPLTYGNTSAGVVAIESTKKLESNEVQVSTTLASAGLLVSQNLSSNSFIQAFTNYQFSGPFVSLNKSSLENLNNFGSWDAGINFHTNLGKWSYNSFVYLIDEYYDVSVNQFTFESNALANKQRLYTVQNLYTLFESGKLSIDLGYNNSKSSFAFGNLHTNRKNQDYFASIRYKHYFVNEVSLETGFTYDQQTIHFRDSIPKFYYALSPSSPNVFEPSDSQRVLPESFIYLRKKLNSKWRMHAGLRTNFKMTSQQVGISYQPASSSRLILSGGNYYSYTRPSYNLRNFALLRSNQIALDYDYTMENLNLQAAIYYKRETGERSFDFFFPVEQVNTFGLEFFVDWDLHAFWNFTFSNNFIDQRQNIFGQSYPGNFDFNYFIKSALTFSHPRWPSIVLSYIGRPGGRYNRIMGGELDSSTNFYVPQFEDQIYGANFNTYNRIDLALSRYFQIGNQSIVCFINLANIFDQKNQQEATYTRDYSQEEFTYFQQRSIFFGVVWSKRKY
jgi:hypothetical protein